MSLLRALSALAMIGLLETSANAQISGAPATAPEEDAQTQLQFPLIAQASPLSESDRSALLTALHAARRGEGAAAQTAMASISDPVARKLALWATIDATGEQLSFLQLDQARRDLAGWPRAQRRQQAAEKVLETSGQGPAATIAWFGGSEPVSAMGAMALATAYQQLNRQADAEALIRRWWRNHELDLETQHQMYNRFGAMLTVDDHIKRADTLLYGPQGQSLRDMLPLLPPDQKALAEARMALREDSYRAPGLVAALPASVADDPGLAIERARYLHNRGLDMEALPLVAHFPTDAPNDDAASRNWTVRRQMINAALKIGDYKTAYAAAAHTGLANGEDFTAAEFYAGWIALAKLHDPVTADQYFGEIQRVGLAPITQSRALYWRGRAAQAMGEDEVAAAFFQAGAQYTTTFYGQLAAERAGQTELVLGHDPNPTPADRARFDGRELIRATRMLGDLDERDLFRTFVLSVDETLPGGAESALLIDLARSYGDQDLAMKVVRKAAHNGHVLPERGYPVRMAPSGGEAPEPAIVFGITRQESGFDPHVRSGVGARGMMQLMPETAHAVARRIGEPYSPSRLDEADYNMRLGAAYLGHMINDFSGSYVLAAAAYNAGPGRPAEWVTYCGDPRTSSVDPVDFVECIPFSETRNYVMRVLEATEVYRARMNSGIAPLTLSADLKRGGYTTYAQSLSPATTTSSSAETLIPSSTTNR
ncbi:lytic transglycosylase domain-containing protein [Phenylobacterium montanum]|nr:lytic transglycosylase domain-containing protein [Caulobacter sp. S6]